MANYKNTKKYTKGKGSKPHYQSKQTERRGPKEKESYDDIHRNDISWWNKPSYIFDQVTQIPFNHIPGDKWKVRNGTGPKLAYSYITIPGVLAIDFVPTIGSCGVPGDTGITDPINMAMDMLYSHIYSKYTGAIQFQKSDVAFYTLLCAQIANWIAVAKRGIRTLQSYSPDNYNYPRVMYAAQGFDQNSFDTEVSSLPGLRSRLNSLIRSFNTLNLPDYSDIFARWYSLCDNIWLDEADISAQAYLFRPCVEYTYVEADPEAETPPSMVANYVDWPDPVNPTINGILDIISGMLADVRNTSFFQLVNGAMYRTFERNNLILVDEISPEEKLTPSFVPHMCRQIQNAFVYDWQMAASNYNITEDPLSNTLACVPYFGFDAANGMGGLPAFFLNMYDGDTSKEAIMEATRFMPAPYNMPILSGGVLETGTEVATKMKIYRISEVDSSVSSTSYFNSVLVDRVNNDSTGPITHEFWGIGSTNQANTDIMYDLTKFRNHPYIYVQERGFSLLFNETTINYANGLFKDLYGDVYKITQITEAGLSGLHEAAKLSIYAAKLY